MVFWKSTDHGLTWGAVNVGDEADGASANSDVDLAVAPDGTLYFVSMWFDQKTHEGGHIVMGVSTDTGSTWRWTMLSQKRFDDRLWVRVAEDGTAHVIWNDGSGVYHTMSRDRGKTWTDVQQIASEGGSSHLAVGPHGEVAVRIVPVSGSGNKFIEGVDLLVVSTDGGATWQKRRVPGERDWAPESTKGATPRWVEPAAWDTRGRLDLLWTQVDGFWLASSEDKGTTWKTWRIAASQGDTLAYYPYLTASGSGELAGTWFLGAGANLHLEVCQFQSSDESTGPQSICSAPFVTDVWTSPDVARTISPRRSTAGEYFPVLILHDSDVVTVTSIQNPATKRFGFTFWRFNPTPSPH